MPSVIEDIEGIPGLVTRAIEIGHELPAGRALWFRGLGKDVHTLVPSLMREGKAAEAVFEREKRLLTRFRQRSLAFWPSGYPQDDWEHLFAMQHYGMPTRLLDWTENLFVALHFALTSASDDAEGAPTISCIDPVAWNRATPVLSEYGETIHVLTTADEEAEAYRPLTNKKRSKTPIAIFGTHNSQRIIAQRGTFFVWGNDTRPLHEFAAESQANLWKLRILGERALLRRQLQSLGFAESMVFPELPYLATELSRSEGWRD